MSNKKTLENRFLDKIVSVYLRLHEEKQDEKEALRLMNAFIRKALGKLGFKGTTDKLEARTEQLASLAVERARMEMERRQFLFELRLGQGSASYSVGFLSDVRIPNTPENHAAWTEFMETLAAKTRIGPDPDTGEVAILYRDGVWLGDLMLADDVRSLNVLEDVRRVRGSLTARGARVVNKRFTHRLAVDGDLCVHVELLRQDPPDLHFAGDLSLFGLKSPLDAPFGPERFMAWGLEPGRCLTLRSDSFTLQMEARSSGEPEYVLRGENVFTNYVWRGGKWITVKQERVPQATFEAVHAKLNRLCLELGLGSNFIAKSVSRVPDNIDRIGLYLELALEQAAAGDAAGEDDEEAEGTRRLLDGLYALRPLFAGRRIPPEAVEEALASVTDEDRALAAALAARPRPKLNEKFAQEDLALVTALLDEDLGPLDLLENGLGTARALGLALRSEEMRSNLRQALGGPVRALEDLCSGLELADPPGFAALLEDTKATLAVLRDAARKKGDKTGTAPLEAELRELKAQTPKDLVRRVSGVPFSVESEEFQADKNLLRDLFELSATELDKLPFDAPAMLAFVLPGLKSLAGPRLRAAQAALAGGEMPGDRLASALTETLRDLPADKLAAALRTFIRIHVDVVHKFNELGTLDYGGEREAQREEKERAMVTLSAEATREITQRLGRLCLLTGLGRDFIDPGSTAMEANLKKVGHYLALALAIVPGSPRPLLDQEDRETVQQALDAVRALAHCLDTADSEAAEEALGDLSDRELSPLANVLAKPRHQADLEPLRRDLRYLEGLQATRVSLEQAMGSAGHFLLLANSCLRSKEMKKAISVRIKPVYFALSRLGQDAAGLTTNDLLRNSCVPDAELERLSGNAAPEIVEGIRKSLAKICEKTVAEMVSDLRKSCGPTPEGDLAEDCEFLKRLQALEGNALGTLQLDEQRTGQLLLANLDSHLTSWTKTMFETGRFSGKTSKQIVTLVQERGQWEHDILRTYNKLSTRVR